MEYNANQFQFQIKIQMIVKCNSVNIKNRKVSQLLLEWIQRSSKVQSILISAIQMTFYIV